MPFLLSQYKHVTPDPIIVRLAELYSSSSVLDVGTGSGQNAIFLAEQGFTVTAIDKEVESVAEINDYLQQHPLPLEAKIVDLKSTTPNFSEYTAVLFLLILHHLKRGRAEVLLSAALTAAQQGTVHAVSIITTEGDFYSRAPEAYYPQPGELRARYEAAGWKIIEHEETVSEMRHRREDGTSMQNLVTHLIAEKQ